MICATLALFATACPASSPQPRAAEVFDATIALDFTPSYIALRPRPGGHYLYVESTDGGSRGAYAMRLDANGAPLGPLTAVVARFRESLADVFTAPDGALVVPVTRTPGGVAVVLEWWRWDGLGPAERIIDCYLPRPVFGRALYREADPLFVYEDERGELVALRLDGDDDRCGLHPDVTTLLRPPLPRHYLVDTFGDALAVSGAVGDSYTLRLYGPDLAPTQRLRMAVGRATNARDFELFELEGHPPYALFAAVEGGVHDLFLAELPSFGASTLHAERVVATADPESSPHLVSIGGALVISWVVEDGTDRLRVAAPVPPNGIRVRGGEVMWRMDTTAAVHRAWAWTDAGFLRAWTESGALHLSVYEPTFWR